MVSKTITFEEIFGKPISRDEALDIIKSDSSAYHVFSSQLKDHRDIILEFISSKKSLCITYDTFFKKIFSPSEHPRRLEALISAILDEPIEIVKILPREGTMISDKGSFVVMDIIIRTISGAIINVEMQKIGYKFPGQRSDCYIADSVMRQYNMAREEYGKDFMYQHINPSYLIILMEDSPNVFRDNCSEYMHIREVKYNTGIELPTLENVRYIALDTFDEVMQNKDVTSDLEAWLTFLSCTDIDRINKLLSSRPQFAEIYEEIRDFRRNLPDMMNTFSEALRIMDHNTELYMIDEAKKKLAATSAKLIKANSELDKASAELDKTSAELDKTSAELDKTSAELDKASKENEALSSQVEQLKAEIEQLKSNKNNS